MKNKMSLTQEEIDLIRKIKIEDAEWDTSQFPYMNNEQIIECHRYTYNSLIEGLKELRGGYNVGDIFVPIMIKKLLIETKKRFKGKE